MLDQVLTLDPNAFVKLGELMRFLGVVVLCAGVLYLVYRHISPTEPDGVEFASTVFILTIAIGLLVSIIKQAPAISFGLFGAMSIVRFRAQIKRPQRMIFIFMAASIGVCCGAGEYITTLFGTTVLSILTLATFRLVRPAGKAAEPMNTMSGKSKSGNPGLAHPAAAEGRRWGLDFVPAFLADDRRMRCLIIADEATREVLSVTPDLGFSGARVVVELDRLLGTRDKPAALVSESWPEFGSKAVKDWKKTKALDWQWFEAADTGLVSGKTEPLIVGVVQALRDECLGQRVFNDVLEARVVLEKWRESYNQRIASAHKWQLSAPAIHAPKSGATSVPVIDMGQPALAPGE